MKWYSWCIALCDKANWSHTVQELPSQTCYWMKDTSGGKTR
jgi:hypothetical protein